VEGPGDDGWNPNDGTGVTEAQFAAWSKVAVCEEGSWANYQEGPNYYGSLGISSAAWDEYGQGVGRVDATPDQQIEVALRIQSQAPDQAGTCSGW